MFIPTLLLGALLLPTTHQPAVLVDPEPSVLVSTTPVTLVEPPPRLKLKEVIDRAQWRGMRSGVTEPRFAIFRHADKWEKFWKDGLAPYSHRMKEPPPIDFEKDMVIGVFLGEKPVPVYEIEIRSAAIEGPWDARRYVVRYREIHHMEGVFVPAFAVQPFHLKKVVNYDGEIVFRKVKR